MKIIKKTMEWHWCEDLLQDRSATFKEEEINIEDVKPFSDYEIELFKKWLEIWQYAWDNELDGWELNLNIKKEFEEDVYKKYIRRFDVLSEEWLYEPEDFLLLNNNTIRTPMGDLINLEFTFLKTKNDFERDSRLVTYVKK